MLSFVFPYLLHICPGLFRPVSPLLQTYYAIIPIHARIDKHLPAMMTGKTGYFFRDLCRRYMEIRSLYRWLTSAPTNKIYIQIYSQNMISTIVVRLP